MIGKRIYAWRGPRMGHYGKVVRVDGQTHCFVVWETDGSEEHTANRDLCWAEFIK